MKQFLMGIVVAILAVVVVYYAGFLDSFLDKKRPGTVERPNLEAGANATPAAPPEVPKSATAPPPAAYIWPEKNVLYIGVENPLHLEAIGVPLNDIVLKGNNVFLKKIGNDQYNARAITPGESEIVAEHNGTQIYTRKFLNKRVPDPVAHLGGKFRDGLIGNGEFKAKEGLTARIENFPYEVSADITGFELIYIPRKSDPVFRSNVGARFNDLSKSSIQQAKPGDVYLFTEVRAKLPGEGAPRSINSLAFFIQ